MSSKTDLGWDGVREATRCWTQFEDYLHEFLQKTENVNVSCSFVLHTRTDGEYVALPKAT